MKIFVTGGTGVVGRRLIPLLVGAGHEVTALVRSADRARLVTEQGAAPAEVGLFDRDALTAAARGHEVVVNLATSIPPLLKMARLTAWRDNDRIRSEGSANVVDAALAGGAERIVQESVAFLYADQADRWIAEDAEVDPPPIARSALDAEAQARRFSAQGGTAVVLRFAAFYGPDSEQSVLMSKAARWGWGSLLGSPDAYWSSIDTGDAAGAVLAAVLEAPGRTYNVGDDEPLTRRQFEESLAAAVGRRSLRSLPGLAARLGGDRLATLTRSLRLSNAAFRAATSWQPRYPSAREGLKAAVSAIGTGA